MTRFYCSLGGGTDGVSAATDVRSSFPACRLCYLRLLLFKFLFVFLFVCKIRRPFQADTRDGKRQRVTFETLWDAERGVCRRHALSAGFSPGAQVISSMRAHDPIVARLSALIVSQHEAVAVLILFCPLPFCGRGVGSEGARRAGSRGCGSREVPSKLNRSKQREQSFRCQSLLFR